MRKWFIIVMAVCVALSVSVMPAVGATIGGGANYWVALENIDTKDIDENGLSWFVSLQMELAELLKLEGNVEVFTEDFGGAGETVYAPQAYALLGSVIYAGLGVGGLYADGEFAEDPFYGICAGLDLELLPNIHLDIRGNYRFMKWDDLFDGTVIEDLDVDTISLGVAARIEF